MGNSIELKIMKSEEEAILISVRFVRPSVLVLVPNLKLKRSKFIIKF